MNFSYGKMTRKLKFAKFQVFVSILQFELILNPVDGIFTTQLTLNTTQADLKDIKAFKKLARLNSNSILGFLAPCH